MTNLITHFERTTLSPKEARKSIHELTSKEKEVLALLAQGYAAKHIADIMDISVLTVYTHLNHIYKKIGVYSATQATSYYNYAEYGVLDFSAKNKFLDYV